MNLHETLKSLRGIKKYSIRKVEKITGISNAYISQMENGKVKKPSPDKLKKLAECYDFPYVRLMEIVGYIDRNIYCPPNMLLNIKFTAKEEQQLLAYLRFIRTECNV